MNDTTLLSAIPEIVERIPPLLVERGIVYSNGIPFEQSRLSLLCLHKTGRVFIAIELDCEKVFISCQRRFFGLLPTPSFL
jgi:hypothetical protein